jgi:hypothetical protein
MHHEEHRTVIVDEVLILAKRWRLHVRVGYELRNDGSKVDGCDMMVGVCGSDGETRDRGNLCDLQATAGAVPFLNSNRHVCTLGKKISSHQSPSSQHRPPMGIAAVLAGLDRGCWFTIGKVSL